MEELDLEQGFLVTGNKLKCKNRTQTVIAREQITIMEMEWQQTIMLGLPKPNLLSS